MAKSNSIDPDVRRAICALGNGLMAIEHAATVIDYQADGALTYDQIQAIAGLIAAQAESLQNDFLVLARVLEAPRGPDEADQPAKTEKEHPPLILDDEAELMIQELEVKMSELREDMRLIKEARQ